MKIFTVIGGISEDSINKKLFELIKPLVQKDFQFDTFDQPTEKVVKKTLKEEIN